jgi:hypothetical protein
MKKHVIFLLLISFGALIGSMFFAYFRGDEIVSLSFVVQVLMSIVTAYGLTYVVKKLILKKEFI